MNIVIFLTIIASSAINLIPQNSELQEDVRCGSYCLAVALKSLGSKQKLDELEQRLGEPSLSGYSLLQLANASKDLGFKIALIQTDLDQLIYRKKTLGERFTCITLVKDDHFVLLYDTKESDVLICDPPFFKKSEVDVFKKTWSGKALLISSLPLATEEEIGQARRNRHILSSSLYTICLFLILSTAVYFLISRRAKRFRRNHNISTLLCFTVLTICGCNGESASPVSGSRQFGGVLTLSPETHELGILQGGVNRSLRVDSKLTNSGSQALVLLNFIASCDCTSAQVGKKVLAPGESTILSTNIKLGDSSEPRMTRIQIHSNDQNHPTQSIVYKWKVENPIFTAQPSYTFLELPTGEPYKFTIPINSRFITLCNQCRLTFEHDSDLIKSEWLPNQNLFTKNHLPTHTDDKVNELGLVNLRLDRRSDDNFVDRTLEIKLTCGEDLLATSSIPIKWSVQRPIVISPSRITLGKTKTSEKHSKELLIKVANGKIRIKGITCIDNNVKFSARYPAVSFSDAILSFEIVVPQQTGLWREFIQIETDFPGSEKIFVPVSCIIEE